MRAIIVLLGALAAGAGAARAEEPQVITIATGLHGGVYLHTGRSICRLVNAGHPRHGLRCVARSSPSAQASVRDLLSGVRAYAVVPSDELERAYNATGRYAGADPASNLRVVLALQEEPFVALVSPQSGIRSLEDLRARRVSLGPAGGIDRELAARLLETSGWREEEVSNALELDAERAVAALCAAEIDAAFLRIGHPTGWVEEAIERCGARLLPLAGSPVDALIESMPYVHRAIVEGGTYAGHDDDVTVLGLDTILVTSSDRPDGEVSEVAGAVVSNLADFRRLHATLAELDRDDLADVEVDVPLHPGAERYLRAAGIIR